jgi:hypothetical protein
VFPALFGEEFLSARVDVRADGTLGHVADSGPLGIGVALGLPNGGPFDRLVDRAVAGEQLSTSLEEVLLCPRECEVFELVSVAARVASNRSTHPRYCCWFS